jgi:hypothetical protein
LLSLAISFLAGLVGLGKVSSKIREIVQKVRDTVDKAIEAAVTWIINKAKSLFKSLFGGKDKKPDIRTDAQKEADLNKGVSEAEGFLQQQSMSVKDVKAKLPGIKSKYKLTSLDLVTEGKSAEGEKDHIEGVINPKKVGKTVVKQTGDPQLDALGAQLVLPKSKIYFNEVVSKNPPATALDILKAEDARTDKMGLRPQRNSAGLGPNIERSPTVAIISANIPGVGAVGFTGMSGSFDAAPASKLRLNAVSKTHAEGRCLTKVAAIMDSKNATGGTGSIKVDKPPCGFCSGTSTSMKNQYGMTVSITGP